MKTPKQTWILIGFAVLLALGVGMACMRMAEGDPTPDAPRFLLAGCLFTLAAVVVWLVTGRVSQP